MGFFTTYSDPDDKTYHYLYYDDPSLLVSWCDGSNIILPAEAARSDIS